MNTFDIIVIGGGISGGIPAATYLQKAGKSVAIVDSSNELGIFIPTCEHWPGVISSPHASINFSGASPAWDDLGLEDHGYRIVVSPVVFAVSGRDGKNCMVFYDPAKTAESFGRHSEKDGKTVEAIQARLVQTLPEFNEMIVYTPPAPNNLKRIWDYCAWVFGVKVSDFMTMNGIELLERTFEADYPRRTLCTLPSLNLMGDPFARGQGAACIVFSLVYTSAQAIGGNHSLAHAMLRIFQEHGGKTIRNSPVERIIVENGRAVGVDLAPDAAYPHKTLYARNAVLSNLGALNTLKVVGEEVMQAADAKLWAKMKYWKTDTRASVVSNWVLKTHPTWNSEKWDPSIKKAHLIYRAWDSWEHMKSWSEAIRSQDRQRAINGLIEILDYSVVDPSQASAEGYVSFRAEEAQPFHWRREGKEPDYWDDARPRLMEARDALFEEMCPGFKKIMLDHIFYTPLDLWRYNPVAVFGQVVGGDFSEDQWYLDRMPYRMPIQALYMSNNVWPLALSWMAPGYNAACTIAEDLRIRNQPWWRSRPVEWFFRNIGKLMVEYR